MNETQKRCYGEPDNYDSGSRWINGARVLVIEVNLINLSLVFDETVPVPITQTEINVNLIFILGSSLTDERF